MTESTTGTLPLATAPLLGVKIRSRRARVGVVGLGYVGLPLAVEFAAAGFTVTGIDISEEKVRRVNAGDSYVGDIPSATLAPLVESGRLRATTDFSAVLDLDTINICVPTPLRKTKDPDMSRSEEHTSELNSLVIASPMFPSLFASLSLPIFLLSFFLALNLSHVNIPAPLKKTKILEVS